MSEKLFGRKNIGIRYIAVFAALGSICFATLAMAQSANLVQGPVNAAQRAVLAGHHPAWANAQNDAGAVPSDLAIEHVTVLLNRPPQLEQAYKQFLQDQQNPASPDYHHWLTPIEIGQRFGASMHDIEAVKAWLVSQGLRVDAISNSHDRITFSGPASAFAAAFGAEMHYYTVSGDNRISVNTDPQIPIGLKNVIRSISGLYTVKAHPQHISTIGSRSSPHFKGDADVTSNPDFTLGAGNYVIFPSDFAVIYNLNGITGGINGTGETIAIIGRSGVCAADITNFASVADVTANLPNTIVPPLGISPPAPDCTDGTGASGDQGEATLDVTRSGSIAQGAALDLVVSADSNTVDGIGVAATYVVDTPPSPAPKIMSISFGSCETENGSSGVDFWDSLFTQAAGEGISVFVSSGDSAAAGCDDSFSTPPASQSLSINAICSSSYATCVGGTEFADFTDPSQYWSSTNGGASGTESALSYIPEGAWNEPYNSSNQLQVAGSGGGVSIYIATPTWQVGTGVPGSAGRYVPDVAFSASQHDGYFGCLAGGGGSCVNSGSGIPFVEFAGTSAAAPDMAGITALLNQQEGSAQGQLNPTLYSLAATTSNAVFNDVTVASSGVTGCVVTTPSMCNNSTAGPNTLTGGLSGYLVNAGYDEATGWGSINVANLLTNWTSSGPLTPTSTALTVSPAAEDVGSTTPVVLTATVTSGGGTPTGTVKFFNGSTMIGSGALISGAVTFNYGTAALTAGAYSLTATYVPTGSFSGSTSSASTLSVQDFSFPAPAAITVATPGSPGSTTLTLTALDGFNQAVTLACPTTGLPSETTCAISPASVTFTGGTATATMTITTTAASSRLERDPSGRSRGLFYALMLPGIFGVVLAFDGRKKRLSAYRMLGWIVILGCSMLWMPACGGGGSSGGQSNPGTPAGTSSLTVTATSGTLSHSAVVTLTVQ
jgi:subtilase family serine protease